MVENGVGRGNVTVLQKQRKTVDIDILFKRRMLIKCFKFRTKKKKVFLPVIIKRLHPGTVSKENNLFFIFVVERNGKHTNKPVYHILSPAFITFKNDLGVRPRFKLIAFILQLFPDLLEIVNLS